MKLIYGDWLIRSRHKQQFRAHIYDILLNYLFLHVLNTDLIFVRRPYYSLLPTLTQRYMHFFHLHGYKIVNSTTSIYFSD